MQGIAIDKRIFRAEIVDSFYIKSPNSQEIYLAVMVRIGNSHR